MRGRNWVWSTLLRKQGTSGVGCRVVSGSRLCESLVTEVGKHFLTYTVRALLAECLVSLRCPKLNKIISVFRKSISCLRFGLSESKKDLDSAWKGKSHFPSDEIHKFLCWFREGNGSCGRPWKLFCPSNTSQPTGYSSKPETVCWVWMLPLRGSVSFPSLWVQNSHTLSMIAGKNGYLVITQTLVTHLVLVLCDIALSKIINGKLCSSPTKWYP